MPDEENERPPGPGVVELHIDLAGRGVEPHFDPDRGDRAEHQELRKVAEGGVHGPRTTSFDKRCGFHTPLTSRLNRSPDSTEGWR
jgi:hypothetical protein